MCIYALCFLQHKTSAQTIIPGEIPVVYDVTPTGSFQYSIPLRIPPGVRDMVPNLAITYASQGGNGMLGMGWSLSGLSTITRGQPTIYYRQEVAPVDFDDDQLFLDGERIYTYTTLSGNFGVTEVKNFATIQHHTSGSGSYYSVEYPNGVTYEYGNSSSSKMLAQGSSHVLMWAVNKIYDVHGNYITFNYTNNQSIGDYRISSITYGQNSISTTDIPITIEFNYTSRPDVNKAYVHGSEVISDKLLDNIRVVFSNNTQANKYKFYYNVAELHPRLTKIEELRDGNEMLPPINVSWGTTSSSLSTAVTSTTVTGGAVFAIGDFNGDGYSDYVTTPNTGSSTNDIKFYENDKQNDFTLLSSISQPFVNNSNVFSTVWESASGKLLADWNGDGLDDLVLVTTENNPQGYSAFRLHLFTSTGTQLSHQGVIFEYSNNSHNPINNAHEYYVARVRVIPGDFDGDKRMDFIVMTPNGLQSVPSPTNYVGDGFDYFIVGAGYSGSTTQSGNWGSINPGNWAHVGTLNKNVWDAQGMDFNGDGKTDLLITSDQVLGIQNMNGCEIFPIGVTYDNNINPTYNSTHNPIVTTIFGDPGTSYTYSAMYWGALPTNTVETFIAPGDFNGDGKDDLLYWQGNHTNISTTGTWSIAYSTGIGFSFEPLPSSMSAMFHNGPHIPHKYSYYVADFNGDGMDDIIQLTDPNHPTYTGVYNYDIYYSEGNNTFTVSSNSITNFAARSGNVSIGDFNGDGQADLLSHNQGFAPYIQKLAFFYPENKAYQVASIEHAGKTLYIEQELLTRDPDYTSNLSLTYPYSSRLLAISVVKSLSDDVTMNNSYIYKNLVMHSHGFGLRGFEKFEKENSSGHKTYQTFNLTTQIPYLLESKEFDPFGSLPYASLTTYDRIDIDGGVGSKCRIIMPYSTTIDYIAGQTVETTITTGPTASGTVFYDYGRVESTEVRTKDLNGGNNSLQTTTFNYGSSWVANKGKPESVTVYKDIDPNGSNGITRTTEYTYNSNGTINTVKTDPGTPNEKTTTHTLYDDYGNLLQKDLLATGIANTITNKFEYSADGKFLTKEENTIGYYTTYDYGSLAQLAATWGNVLSETGIKGLVTEYEYDVLNRVTTVRDVAHSLETYTSYIWASSSPYATGQPDEHIEVTTTNSANLSHNTTIYDKYGRTIRKAYSSLAGEIYEDFTYTLTGKIHTSKNPYHTWNPGIIVTNTNLYDAYDRLVETSSSSNGPVIQKSYSISSSGLLSTTVTNLGSGKSKTSLTCGSTLRKVIGSVNGGSGTDEVEFTYHGNGTPATTNSNGQIFTNTVDQFGRLINNTQPNAGTISYEYDALDRITKETLANGIAYELEYDDLGRIVQKQEMGSANPPYTYLYENTMHTGATGELTQKTDPNSYSYQYMFNNNGELIQLSENAALGFAITTNYSYYPDGKLRYYSFYNDITIEYNYGFHGFLTEANLISGANIPLHKLWLEWDSDAYGQLQGAYHFDQSNNPLYTVGRSHTEHGLLTRRSVNHNTLNIPLADQSYSFDIHTGNLSYRTDNTNGRNYIEYFNYDPDFDRLVDVSESLGAGSTIMPTANIAYDNIGLGNITKKTDAAVPVLNPNTGQPFDWKYDNYALQTIARQPGAGNIPLFTQDVEYYPFQKVKKITEDSKNEVLLTYGPDNERVKAEYYDKSSGSLQLMQTKYYAHNYERIEDPINGRTELLYVWAEDELVAILKLHTPQPVINTQHTGTVYYPVRDHLGSITHLLDDQGMGGMMANGVIEERSFDAWGRIRDPQTWQPYGSIVPLPAPWITDRGYTGHEHIWTILNSGAAASHYNNNIINMNGRLYDPLIGRMFSPDPAVPDATNSQDYNKYMYARNNPLKYTDPDGNVVWFVPVIYAAVNVGVDLMINKGKMNFGQICMSAASGAIGGLLGGGAITSVGGAFLSAGLSQVNKFVPGVSIYQSDNFNLSISPMFGMGTSGMNFGASVNASGTIGELSYGTSIGGGFNEGISSLGDKAGSSLFYNFGGYGSLRAGNTPISLGYSWNSFTGGATNQGVGALTLRVGDFSLRIDEDFGIGDWEDRYRTGGMIATYRVNNDVTLALGSSMLTGDADFNQRRYEEGGYEWGTYDNCAEKGHNLRAGTLYGGVIYKGQAYFMGHNSEKRLHSVQNWIHRNLTKNSAYFEDRAFRSRSYSYFGGYHASYLYY